MITGAIRGEILAGGDACIIPGFPKSNRRPIRWEMVTAYPAMGSLRCDRGNGGENDLAPHPGQDGGTMSVEIVFVIAFCILLGIILGIICIATGDE